MQYVEKSDFSIHREAGATMTLASKLYASEREPLSITSSRAFQWRVAPNLNYRIPF